MHEVQNLRGIILSLFENAPSLHFPRAILKLAGIFIGSNPRNIMGNGSDKKASVTLIILLFVYKGGDVFVSERMNF